MYGATIAHARMSSWSSGRVAPSSRAACAEKCARPLSEVARATNGAGADTGGGGAEGDAGGRRRTGCAVAAVSRAAVSLSCRADMSRTLAAAARRSSRDSSAVEVDRPALRALSPVEAAKSGALASTLSACSTSLAASLITSRPPLAIDGLNWGVQPALPSTDACEAGLPPSRAARWAANASTSRASGTRRPSPTPLPMPKSLLEEVATNRLSDASASVNCSYACSASARRTACTNTRWAGRSTLPSATAGSYSVQPTASAGGSAHNADNSSAIALDAGSHVTHATPPPEVGTAVMTRAIGRAASVPSDSGASYAGAAAQSTTSGRASQEARWWLG